VKLPHCPANSLATEFSTLHLQGPCPEELEEDFTPEQALGGLVLACKSQPALCLAVAESGLLSAVAGWLCSQLEAKLALVSLSMAIARGFAEAHPVLLGGQPWRALYAINGALSCV